MSRKMCPRCGLHQTYNYQCVPCGDIDRAAAKASSHWVKRRIAAAERKAASEALGITLGESGLRLREAAQKFTRVAVAEGFLLNPKDCKCTDCPEQAECYDHRDYGKPMDVEPVCRSCNCKRYTGFMPERVVQPPKFAAPQEMEEARAA